MTVSSRIAGTHAARLARPLALLAVASVACDNPPTAPDPTGASEVAVSGDVVRNLRGDAFFEELVTQSGQTLWLFHLVQGPPEQLQSVDFVRRGPRPGPGSYEILPATQLRDLPPGGIAAFVALDPIAGGAGFASESTTGTMTLTASAGDRVRGEARLLSDGVVILSSGQRPPGQVRVQASFEAVRGELVTGPGLLAFLSR